MSDASALPDDPLPRPSRQQLVVPPRQSAWPVALGAVGSAVAGFGLVLVLGIGRSRPTDEAPPPGPPEVALTSDATDDLAADAAAPLALAAAPATPGLLSADDLEPPASSRWSPRGESEAPPTTEPPEDRYADRYQARAVSHDESVALPTDESSAARPASRFSSTDLPPPAATIDEPADLPDLVEEQPVVEPPAALPTDEASAPDLPLHDTAGLPEADAPVEPASEAMAFDTAVDAPSTAAPIAAAAQADHEAAEPTEPAGLPAASESPGDVAESSSLPAAAPDRSVPVEPEPVATDQARAAASPPAERRPPEPAAAIPVALPVAAFALPTSLPAPPISPFAAAPPLGHAVTGGSPVASSPGAAVPAAMPAAEPAALSAPAGIEGQGLPGPVQLEGVQAPQLAVEKRGPREIQVGKPARYEILVRNVGAAIAHEVTLRDAVPQGTSLIATTPPASPAADETGPSADLVWMLGDLHPGGEARVLMELMPQSEGEVGSVASVSFRADATLRSRATKPELALDWPAAKPIRIGGDMEVSITVSNPGSGTATGVVVEAFLPESVSHRAGPELEFDVGQLRPGESKTIDLVLGTRSPGSQPARLVARADGGIEVDHPLPMSVTAPMLELAIEMPSRRFLQRPATCEISMVNTGTASARSVELAAQLPPGMKFVRANNAGWHDERTHRVLWNLEELPAGETGTVAVVVMPVQAGEQRITAAARSTDGPSDQVIHACQVEGLAAVAFQVVDSEDPIEVDGVTEYVVRVANEGTKAASGVRLTANLLGDLEPVEAEGPGRHRIENLVIEFEPLAKLGPGEEVVYRISARGRRAGHQRVQVQLTSEDNPTPITKEEVTSVYDDR